MLHLQEVVPDIWFEQFCLSENMDGSLVMVQEIPAVSRRRRGDNPWEASCERCDLARSIKMSTSYLLRLKFSVEKA